MKHMVGVLQDFAAGQWRLVQVQNSQVGIFNTGEQLWAVRNRCPHEGAPLCTAPLDGTMLPCRPGELAFGLEGRVLRCPWHGWEFDVASGDMLFGTGTRRATVYPVSVEAEQVFVEAGQDTEKQG